MRFNMSAGLAAIAQILCDVNKALAAPQQTLTLFDPTGDFDYQIGGSFNPNSTVKTISRDYEESDIVEGLYNICYINAFQSQSGDALARKVVYRAFHTMRTNSLACRWEDNAKDLLLQKNGEPYLDPDWGEYIFDTTTDAERQALAGIVKPWIKTCSDKGFNAIEPDNLDTFNRFDELSKEGNLAFAKILSDYAHSLNLAFAQKNAAGLEATDKTAGGFDFAIAEECAFYNECNTYTDLYGDHVLEIEYSDNKNAASVFTKACTALGAQIPITYRDRDVSIPTKKKYVNEHC
ncbi:glycoside hydrolase family 114 protein [Flagelloscypha sp. PMI_526]|nr:glycoside hydrolase family 114 protein [Flagelloscypha sp. PMI_526]